MVGLTVTLPEKWTKLLKQLADNHEIDVNIVINEMCEWVFSDSESKEQFTIWLDGNYPPKGEAEDETQDAEEEAEEDEEETEEESEEESDEHD